MWLNATAPREPHARAPPPRPWTSPAWCRGASAWTRAQSLASIADLAHLAETQVRSIQQVQRFVADIAEAQRLGRVPGEHYFCVSSIRVDRDNAHAPICWTDVYAQEGYAAVIEDAERHPDDRFTLVTQMRREKA